MLRARLRPRDMPPERASPAPSSSGVTHVPIHKKRSPATPASVDRAVFVSVVSTHSQWRDPWNLPRPVTPLNFLFLCASVTGALLFGKVEPRDEAPEARTWGQWCWPVSTNPLWRSEEHTSELQSLMRISYAVFCLK